MKKLLSKPGFEVIFSLSLFAILCLPPLVIAQTTKDIEIKIVNGDTTINGTDIKKLNAEERADALQEIGKMGTMTFRRMGKDGQADIFIRRRKDLRGDNLLREQNGNRNRQPNMNGNDDPSSSPYKTDFYSNNDALEPNQPRIRLRRPGGLKVDSTVVFRYKDNGPLRLDLNEAPPLMPQGRLRPARPNERDRFMTYKHHNTQTFNYTNTGNDGISTNISFNVSDATKEDLKNIAGADKTTLAINDITLSPEFSTGKTFLSFNLALKNTATLKLTNSDGKVLIADKIIAGNYNKKITLPLNGIYFLIVKQGANAAVKRIVKEN